MATKGVNPFAKMPTKATTKMPAAAGPKMPAGAGVKPGAKVSPFATGTSGPAFKKGGMSKGGKC